MEPASAIIGVASGAASLAVLALQVSRFMIGMKDAFDHIEIRLIDLVSLCRTLEVAWKEIANWASQQASHGEVSTAVLEQLQHCCETSKMVLEAVSKDFNQVSSKGKRTWQLGSKDKGRAVMHESNLREHGASLRGQINSLHLLISTATLSVYP